MTETLDSVDLLIIGLLVRESSLGGAVHCSSIQAALSAEGCEIGDDELRARLDEIVRTHPTLGLTWDGASKSRLRTIAGVHWWSASDAYLELVRGGSDRLAQLFADVSREALEHRAARPRLLVDGGVAPFHCLSHRHCHLAENASEILTNNLFVAQALPIRKVRLLSGEWDLRTAALVNCTDKPARLEQLLSARQRRPDVTIMSFDSIRNSAAVGARRSADQEVALFMEHAQESQLKLAALGTTKLAVFIVVDGVKIGRAPVAEAPCCAITHLIASQTKTQHAARDIYIITDLQQPNPEQQAVIERLSTNRLRDHRIWLVSPEVDTRHPAP